MKKLLTIFLALTAACSGQNSTTTVKADDTAVSPSQYPFAYSEAKLLDILNEKITAREGHDWDGEISEGEPVCQKYETLAVCEVRYFPSGGYGMIRVNFQLNDGQVTREETVEFFKLKTAKVKASKIPAVPANLQAQENDAMLEYISDIISAHEKNHDWDSNISEGERHCTLFSPTSLMCRIPYLPANAEKEMTVLFKVQNGVVTSVESAQADKLIVGFFPFWIIAESAGGVQ